MSSRIVSVSHKEIFRVFSKNDLSGFNTIIQQFFPKDGDEDEKIVYTQEIRKLFASMLIAASACDARGKLNRVMAEALIGQTAQAVDSFIFMRALAYYQSRTRNQDRLCQRQFQRGPPTRAAPPSRFKSRSRFRLR